jgi:hypothetical protein
MNTSIRAFYLVPLLLAAAALGCGSRNAATAAKVSGKVRYNGNLVTAGTITFHTFDGNQTGCAISGDGSYVQTDMPVGEATITVETESARPRDQEAYTGGRGGGTKGAQTFSPAPQGASNSGGGTYTKIPDKYAKVETSGLKKTLTKGSNSYDIELKD